MYILENRKRKGVKIIPNKTYSTVGIFSTEKLAQTWVRKHYKTWFGNVKKYKKKGHFWAICRSNVDSGESYLVRFLTIEGKSF